MGIEYQPICDVIRTLAESAREIADDFFTHHARVEEQVPYRARHQAISRYTLVAKDPIGRDQQRQLSKLLDDIDRLSGSTWSSGALRERTQACRQTCCEGVPYRDFAHNHKAAFRDSVDEIVHIAGGLTDTTPGQTLLVPDLGAVLDFPALENWIFPQFLTFNLVLPTTLVAELEEMQNSALDQRTWQQCALAIRQLQDYRRRGCWNEGVFLNGHITLSVQPLAPVFDDAVDWLDPASPKDRIVAQVIHLIRDHPRCVVALVSGDATLQKSADESRIDTVPPPDPDVEAATG
jgi:hypothetical protein